MSKSKPKREFYNHEVVKVLADKYNVGTPMVRASIRGDRHSETAESIKKDYAQLTLPTKIKIEQFKNQ